MNGGEYEQSSVVIKMHRAPRFGHTSSLAAAASSNPDSQQDYQRGVIAFSILMFVLLLIWVTVLITLKFKSHGCAAGGNVIDISYWRKKDKARLKFILRRSWRVQTVFFVSAIALGVSAALFLRRGIFTISDSLEEILEINSMIGDITFRALSITNSLKQAQTSLNTAEVQSLLDIASLCPNAAANTSSFINSTMAAGGLDSISETLRSTLEDVNQLMIDHVHYAHEGLVEVGEATRIVSDKIEGWFANDWLAKLFVMLLFVFLIFLLIGLFMSRNNIVHVPYRRLLAWFIVPCFAVSLVASVVTTCIFGMLAVVNADFCSGGDSPGSPIGTIEDIVLEHSASREGLLYMSYQYYLDECTTDNPLDFLEPLESELQVAVQQITSVVTLVGDLGASFVNEQCGSQVTPILLGVTLLAENLDQIRVQVGAAIELTSCSSVSPVLRRIFYGPLCDESIDGLTWAYATTLVICISGLTMLTVRAALYNAALRRERKPSERKREREWRDYRMFMSQFYEDADTWKMDPEQTKDCKSLQTGSFDTEVTAQPSADSEEPECIDDSVLDALYVTPRQGGRLRSRLDDTEFAYRTRGMTDVLDSELEPLSPIIEDPPGAPKKSIVSLRRTSQGKLC